MADLGIARMSKETGFGGTLTRADLADVVHRKLGLSRAESAHLVERVLHHMCHALSDGNNVKISGFGSFILRDKGERVGRNPKTGVEVSIAPRQPADARENRQVRWRQRPATRLRALSGRSANCPPSLASPSTSCGIGRAAFHSCGRCSAPATGAITGRPTSSLPAR